MEQKGKTAILVAVVALVISIGGIVFAALTSTLNINGGAEFNPANWNVKFTGTVSKSESGAATGSTPSLTSTTVGTYSVTLTKPGDGVVYKFDVINSGGLNAKISSLTKPSPICTATGDTNGVGDEDLVCDNLIYTLTYDEMSDPTVAVADTLNISQTRTLVLTILYPSSMTSVPEDEVTIEFPTVTIVYEQQ